MPRITSKEFLDSLKGFPEGDDNTYPWSTRLPKGGAQFLQDLQSEWGTPNKSATLRKVVLIVYNYLDKIEEIDLGSNVRDRLYYLDARKEKQERDEIRAELYKVLTEAEREDHPPLRAKLRHAAQRMAKRYNLPWPPPQVPLTEYDAEANYMLDRLMSLTQEHNTNEITLREVVRHTVFDAELARQVLARLEQHDCVTTRTESRSGLPTLVIALPVFSFDYEEAVS